MLAQRGLSSSGERGGKQGEQGSRGEETWAGNDLWKSIKKLS